MANVCLERLTVTPVNEKLGMTPEFIANIVSSLRVVHYDNFFVIDEEPEYLEVECGFRWAPLFAELLSLTTIFPVRLRCVYQEDASCFMGAWRAEDGKVLQDNCIEYC